MILLSHRGNINGRNPAEENNPEYIKKTLGEGYNVEIDVWYRCDSYWLGHDEPRYLVKEIFLMNNKLWCHAKNLPALEKMIKNKKIHCFWHQEDDYTLTSKNIIWTYPGKELSLRSVCVMPESFGIKSKINLPKCFGVCSDHIINFR